MIIIRYFMLMLLYHLLTFYKQGPIKFVKGLILFPFYFLRAFLSPPDGHKDIISASFENIDRYWRIEGAAMPPKFLRERLEAVRREASR